MCVCAPSTPNDDIPVISILAYTEGLPVILNLLLEPISEPGPLLIDASGETRLSTEGSFTACVTSAGVYSVSDIFKHLYYIFILSNSRT